MKDDPLHSLLRDTDGESFRFDFHDGESMLAKVVSSSHVDLDDTIIVLREGAFSAEPGYQIQLADIRRVVASDGRPLFGHA